MRPSAPATPSVESAARAASRLSSAATVTLITPVYGALPIVTFVPGANVTVALSVVTTVSFCRWSMPVGARIAALSAPVADVALPSGSITTTGGAVPLGATTTGTVPLPPPPGRTAGSSAMAMLLVMPSEPADPLAGSVGSASLPLLSRIVAAPPASPSSPRLSRRTVSWPDSTVYENVSVLPCAPEPPAYVALAGPAGPTSSGRVGTPVTTTVSSNLTAISTVSPGSYRAGDGDDETSRTSGLSLSTTGKGAGSSAGRTVAAAGFVSPAITAPLSAMPMGTGPKLRPSSTAWVKLCSVPEPPLYGTPKAGPSS